ncbi:tetratricopeptide repeat protein [Gellertiella hungarica]|uniref:TPR repeat protein n=1 Tax=Gellertiella hungarica TaxID=1572859 RepID=A0A7W6NL84_9HYPH|nr:tetratricopeptide repeat protein [Gellertiella hungarica]MBB4065648.1 TPR repeat protein [Gellertiella hungarica]
MMSRRRHLPLLKWALPVLVGLVPFHARAAANLDMTTEPARPGDISECYRLAGEPYAPPAYSGVAIEAIEPEAAIRACETARQAEPRDAMLTDLAARAYQARGDFETARRLYEEADRAGNAYGKANLAWFFIEGTLGETDAPRGIAMLEAAAATGNSLAQYSLGLIYREGRADVAPDPGKAVGWLEKAAAQGHAIAMYDLAIMLRDGAGVAVDEKASLSWLEKAAGLGDADSMAALGYAYEQGLGTPVDYGKAREWYARAADGQQVDAMTNLGRLYEAGEGGERDYVRAFDLYSRAAEAGNPTAMANLANLYEFGLGTDANPKQAAYWLARAIMAGNEDTLAQLLTAPEDFSAAVIEALQVFLQGRGLYAGETDGKLNPETAAALSKLPGAQP